MDELVSIITPSYNTARYIADTICSVLDQTYPHWEMIIVDDCSTDHTDDVVAGYLADSRIRYLKNERNRGAAESRNYALREARGKWIAFLDSDDLWMPDKLEKQLRFMKQSGYHFSYTSFEEIDEQGKSRGVIVSGPQKITCFGMYNYNWLGCLTVMYDAEYVGLLQIKDIKKNNDYALWLKVCKKTDCYMLNEALAKYRRGRTGSIRSHQGIAPLIRCQYLLYRESEEMGRLRSVFQTCRNLFFGIYKKLRYVSRSAMGCPVHECSK